jgi:hypothetical protein
MSKPITYEVRIDYRYAHKRKYTNTAIYRSREQDVYGILSTFAQHIWMERAKTVTVNCIDNDSYIVDIVPNQPCYVQAVRIYIRRPMSVS